MQEIAFKHIPYNITKIFRGSTPPENSNFRFMIQITVTPQEN